MKNAISIFTVTCVAAVIAAHSTHLGQGFRCIVMLLILCVGIGMLFLNLLWEGHGRPNVTPLFELKDEEKREQK